MRGIRIFFKSPVVQLLVLEDEIDEGDAGDQVDEDGQEGHGGAAVLPGELKSEWHV